MTSGHIEIYLAREHEGERLHGAGIGDIGVQSLTSRLADEEYHVGITRKAALLDRELARVENGNGVRQRCSVARILHGRQGVVLLSFKCLLGMLGLALGLLLARLLLKVHQCMTGVTRTYMSD